MSLEGTNMYMPVTPAYGNGYGNGMGEFGNGWWLIILLLFGYGGFGYGGNYANNGGAMMYPWMNQLDAMNQGFNQQATNAAMGDIRNDLNRGFADNQLAMAGIGQQICQTGNNIVSSMNNGFSQAEISANNRQIANMQQSFNNAQNLDARLNSMQMAQQQCCCDNRASIADLKYTVATENCADRYEAAQNTRDIIDNANRNNQAIMDKLCALELENVKNQLATEQRENASLRNQINVAASTAQILSGQAQRANEIEQYVNPTARPAYIVQNPNCCGNSLLG